MDNQTQMGKKLTDNELGKRLRNQVVPVASAIERDTWLTIIRRFDRNVKLNLRNSVGILI